MIRQEIADQLKNTNPAERKDVIDYYQNLTGFSKQHIYQIANENGYKSNKKKRKDKGILKSGITKDQIEFVAALICESSREKKGAIMPVEVALEIAIDNGIIEHGQLSVGTMTRLLRERQANADAMSKETPHTEMRSLHPNHVHVVDASVCIQYYLRNGKTSLMRDTEFYKNKPQNFEKIKTRLLRYLLVDHFSGAFFPYYFDTTGETQKNLYDFLLRAWENKGDERYPFRGVPFHILMDRGSANISKAIINLLIKNLDIKIPKGMPHNPRKQGSAEVTHNIWEKNFECRLAFKPAWSVEELNQWAFDYAIYYNATKKHTRHDMTRAACWMLIQKEQLRDLPSKDILTELFAEPEKECTVDGAYTISFKGKEYNLKHIQGLFRGAKVMAVYKPLKNPVIDICYQDVVYESQPLPDRLPAHLGAFRSDAAIIGQEYKAQPETLTQQAVKRFENMAYGEEKKKDAIPFEGLIVHGIHADKVGNLAFLEKKGTPIEIDRSITVKEIPFMEFLKRLVQAAGPISKELNQQLRAEFGESIEIFKAEEVIREIEAKGAWDKKQEGKEAAAG